MMGGLSAAPPRAGTPTPPPCAAFELPAAQTAPAFSAELSLGSVGSEGLKEIQEAAATAAAERGSVLAAAAPSKEADDVAAVLASTDRMMAERTAQAEQGGGNTETLRRRVSYNLNTKTW